MARSHGLYGSQQKATIEVMDEERGLRNWWKHQQKLLNAADLKPERIEKFNELLKLGERYKHVNQYA